MVGVVPRPETRRSVLPWRRHQVDVALAPLLEAYLEGHKKADTARIEAACASCVAEDVPHCRTSWLAHAKSQRSSGSSGGEAKNEWG